MLKLLYLYLESKNPNFKNSKFINNLGFAHVLTFSKITHTHLLLFLEVTPVGFGNINVYGSSGAKG